MGAPIPRFYKPSKRIGSTAVMTKRRYRDRWRVVGRFIHPPLFRALSGTAYSRPHRPAQVESHHDAACLQEAQSFAQNQGERLTSFSGIGVTGGDHPGGRHALRGSMEERGGSMASESTRQSVSAVVRGEPSADAPQEVPLTVSLDPSPGGRLSRGLRGDAVRAAATYDARHAHQQPRGRPALRQRDPGRQ